MKNIYTFFVALGFIWVGFWLSLMDPEMAKQLQKALDDGFSKYP